MLDITEIELTFSLPIYASDSDYERVAREITERTPRVESLSAMMGDVVYDFASKAVSVTISDPRGMIVDDIRDIFEDIE